MWNKKLKLAIISDDVFEIDRLVTAMPKFKTLKEMEEAYHLMNQARSVLEYHKDTTLKNINKAKASINFIKSGITFHR